MGPIYQHSKTPNWWYSSQGMRKFNDFSLHSHKISSTSRCLSSPNSMISGNHFSCFSWLVFSRVKGFLAIPFLPKRRHHPKKAFQPPNEHFCAVRRIRTCENWSMLAYCPRRWFEAWVMDSFADVILFGPVYFVFLCLLTAFCKKNLLNHKFMVFVVLFPRLQIDSIEIFPKETGRPTT